MPHIVECANTTNVETEVLLASSHSRSSAAFHNISTNDELPVLLPRDFFHGGRRGSHIR